MPYTAIVIADLETTSLDSRSGEPWEIAFERRRFYSPGADSPAGGYRIDRFHCYVDVDLGEADDRSLVIGGYYERHPNAVEVPCSTCAGGGCDHGCGTCAHAYDGPDSHRICRSCGGAGLVGPSSPGGRAPVLSPGAAAVEVAMWLEGAVLVGCNPAFDDRFLTRLCYRHGIDPGWHYRSVCIEAMAVGWLLGRAMLSPVPVARMPWHSHDVSLALGIDPESFPRHTAAGDVAWAAAMLDAIAPAAAVLPLVDEVAAP